MTTEEAQQLEIAKENLCATYSKRKFHGKVSHLIRTCAMASYRDGMNDVLALLARSGFAITKMTTEEKAGETSPALTEESAPSLGSDEPVLGVPL